MLTQISAFLRTHRLTHLSLVATITIGFFIGYIKDHYHSPASYFLFDCGLALSFLFWLTGTDRLRQLTLPRTPLTQPLLLFYAICFVYVFLSGMPIVVGVSAFRGWCLSTLAFFVGYDLTTSSRQVKVYLWIIVVLAMLSGLYGIYQYAAGIESAVSPDTLVAQRHQFATYTTEEGELEFRIFSTFVSAGAFGTMMAYASLIALALALNERAHPQEKLLLMLAIIPMMTSLVLSGARGALIAMLVGVVILCWYKRRFRIYVMVVALMFLGVRLGIGLTQGHALERFATLADTRLLIDRLSTPLITGWQAIMRAPLGHGLGVTGHGVPFFLLQQHPELDLVFSDGDFGRVMVEMGLVGLLLFGYILVAAIKGAFHALRVLRVTPDQELALAIVAGATMIGTGTLVGSPFLSIPHGMLWWFFMGTLFKLHALWVVRRRHALVKWPRRHRAVKPVRRRARVSSS